MNDSQCNPEAKPIGKDAHACGGGCATCSQMDRPPELGALSGWSLAAGAAGVFVLPLVLALVGSIVVSDRWQWAGALVGLLTGLFGAWCVVALLRRSTRRGHGDSNS